MKKEEKKRKEKRACRYNGAETRKGEANDISWTIVLWAATVAAIISRLTLLFPWRRYGFRIEGHIEVHRLPREDERWNWVVGCKQALWHVHTNHPHLDDENDKKERERDEDKKDEKRGENESERRRSEEEEGHWCVHGVPETAYGNGGVC